MGPMTIIVILILIAAVLVGVTVLRRAGRDREGLRLGTETPCPHCRHLNPTHARFCAQCGKGLS